MDVFAKALAPVLGRSEGDVQQWLSTICQRIAEELALNGRAYLGEIGALERARIPSEPQEENGKLSLAPPRYEVKLVQGETSENELIFEVAVEQLELDEDLAQKLSRGFARVIEKVVEVRGSLKLGELGEFARGEKGGLTFKQSAILSELLNEPFAALAPVTISEARKSAAIEETPAPASVKPETQVFEAPQNVSPASTKAVPSETSFLNSTEAKSLQPKEPLVQPEPPMPSENRHREFLFIALEAAARAQPEALRTEMRTLPSKSVPQTLPQQATKAEPFRFEAQAHPPSPVYPSIAEEEISKSATVADEKSDAQAEEGAIDKETPLMRNIAIATAIVFFTIIIAFVAMKYETISFTPPMPVDRAKVEAEKAAAAKAEAERVVAERTIPKKASAQDSLIFAQTGAILKNATKAAKTLPPELTTIDFSKGGYTLIVASQPTREQATAMAQEFGKLGLAAAVVEKQIGKTTRYRVRVGQFATQAEATAAKRKHKSVIPADAFLDKVQPAPKENATN
ncbi:MAG: SPOR domain-containing protein [Chloroherpetonaceae bacterium]|nr:SPOR domain-containing protein [Chloroherpetonaceae bacterium]MDW8437626.1 SPOR domain-containing protein [Chloroherpetonaceae bacterium]